ncbi:MAG: CBS domain-containing protein [Alphaproteobacteria bacterium]|nr:CBS domain-containing protein [Alphaproteobacteria bacterium]MBU6473444.1 CBS domain-containing protein [Alphaproteobacteria bacterium]MDE2012935.1 CBS domain-containing protein [Alphaproteobacteria bacterium]MDE2352506.1 CBS domain-containing protein [Alphaproteobacteria bacterium]
MSVAAILKTKGNAVYTVRPEHSVSETAAILTGKRVGVAVVCDGHGRIVGVVSERDIVAGVTRYGKAILDMPVRNIMSFPVITCHPDDTVKDIMQEMNERRIRHLPVVEQGELVGIVSIGDAVAYRLRETQLEVGVLRDLAAAIR